MFLCICTQVETRHIDLSMYGAPHGFTAMAQTVGKPAAIASKMILNGVFHCKHMSTWFIPVATDIIIIVEYLVCVRV